MAPTKRSKRVFEEALPDTNQKEHDAVEDEPEKYSRQSINSEISSKKYNKWTKQWAEWDKWKIKKRVPPVTKVRQSF